MKVLMFGWEFPPMSSGGLGTACHGLTKGLSKKGISIIFVCPSLPYTDEIDKPDFIKLISASDITNYDYEIKSLTNLKIKKIDSNLHPYLNPVEYQKYLRYQYQQYQKFFRKSLIPRIYGSNLFEEVYKYTMKAEKIAEQEEFDIIHCHDWMTFGAGIIAKRKKKKSLVLHVHSTEYDRTGGHNLNQYVHNMEKYGVHKADRIIAVSNFTKNKLVINYGVSSEKVTVIHNAIDISHEQSPNQFHINENDSYNSEIKKTDKIVLFLGRITLQKGPDNFIYAAKKVLEKEKNVKFVIAGSGDMEHSMIEKSVELGLANKVLFAGFLDQKDVKRAYKMADVYVMPSISEPFGISALEAMKNKTPVIISKQSGVSEVIHNCLKVNFWDIDELSNKIISVLRYKSLDETLEENAYSEVSKFSWEVPAEKCIRVYNQLINKTYQSF